MIWIILSCLNCDIDSARALAWRSEAVLVGPPAAGRWEREGGPVFASRRECLRALRARMPEEDSGLEDTYGSIVTVIHHPDYLERLESIPGVQFGRANYACFSADPNS